MHKRKTPSKQTTHQSVAGHHLSAVPRGPYSSSANYPVAPRARCVLRYGDTIALATSVAGVSTYRFNLNSLFDPDLTGAGHQPRGFDQLAALYSRYRVYGVSYKIAWTMTGSTNDAVVIGCYPRNGPGSPTTIGDLIENPWAQFTQTNIYQSRVTLTGYVNLAQLNGKTPAAYMSDDTTQALVSASPSESLTLDVTAFSCSGANTPGYITILLEFDSEFSDPLALAAS